MSMIEVFKKELELEALTTRKMLERVPNDKYDWQPHPKSMTIRALATHIAEIPGWVSMTLTTDELDFAAGYNPTIVNDTHELLRVFEENLAGAREQLNAANEADLDLPWTMRAGEVIYFTQSKAEVIRMAYSQIIHHRAQLGVFLRLLDIPIPGSYGPSADEQEMVFESTI